MLPLPKNSSKDNQARKNPVIKAEQIHSKQIIRLTQACPLNMIDNPLIITKQLAATQ